MWAKIKEIFEEEKFALVKTFVWETSIRNTDRKGKVYIHCFESSKGKRKITCDTSFSNIEDVMFIVKQWSVYHEVVYPWLNYGVEPSIPRYNERTNEDVEEDVYNMSLESLLRK